MPLKRTMRVSLGALANAMVNYAGEPYRLFADGALLKKDLADEDGSFTWEHREGTQRYAVELATGQRFEIRLQDLLRGDAAAQIANQGYRSHEHQGIGDAPFEHNGPAFRELVRDNHTGR